MVACCSFLHVVYAQENYGLRFNSFGVSPEDRTSMEIGKSRPLCFGKDMDFSFDFYFRKDRNIYFGYLFRMINNSGQNIDLLYNQKDLIFNTVVAGTFGHLDFAIDQKVLFENWTNIRYHFTEKDLSCFINGKFYKTIPLDLKDRCFKILFGANNLLQFGTTDVPPMVIRNVRISETNRPQYVWPLCNQVSSSNIVEDSVAHEKAIVVNPIWQSTLHQQWQLLRTLHVNGNASLTYDQASDKLFIASEDSVYRVDVADIQAPIKPNVSNGYRLFQGNQTVYNNTDNKLYNFYIDKHLITNYVVEKATWNNKFDSVPNTEFGHANSIYVRGENALYIFGGYGQMQYKNLVQRYDFSSQKWDTIRTKGDHFTPRYMAAAGKSGDNIYILGGYGSQSGDQLLNPGYLYDLMEYHIPTQTFKKLYTLRNVDSTFVFAGSMYIDSATNSFYALRFDRVKYDTKLRLLKGNLSSPDFELLGNDIPYAFNDVVSDADLFYSPNTKQLLAVTQLITLDKNTEIKIYSIEFPPMGLEPADVRTPVGKPLLYIILSVILIGGIWFIFQYAKKKKTPIHTTPNAPQPLPVLAEEKIAPTPLPTAASPVIPDKDYNQVIQTELADKANYSEPAFVLERQDPVVIHVFGRFEMFNTEGEDVAKDFSPLLKELFLIVLLYTLKNGKGISSEKLNDIFWENKTGKNAKNNLSVNMVRVKNILGKVGKIQISRDGDFWYCEYDNKDVSIDLADYLQLRKIYPDEHGRSYISKMLYFISRGAFLKQMEFSWLDDSKADVNNKIVDELIKEVAYLDPEKDADYIVEVANNIFNFDPLNEEALQYKCKVLDSHGRHSIAKTTYERFAKDYKKSFGEDFPVSFNEVLK